MENAGGAGEATRRARGTGAGSGSGTLGLDLVDDDTIEDGAGNKLGGTGTGNGNFTGQVYNIDRAQPTVTGVSSTQANGSYSVGVVIPAEGEPIVVTRH